MQNYYVRDQITRTTQISQIRRQGPAQQVAREAELLQQRQLRELAGERPAERVVVKLQNRQVFIFFVKS